MRPVTKQIVTFVTAEQAKSVKDTQPPAHLVDKVDFMEAGDVDTARGPFAAHVGKSDISVDQVFAQLLLFMGFMLY